MSTSQPKKDNEAFRNTIATVDAKGNRIWLYPKKPKGWYTNLRTYFSWILLAVFFGMPFIKVNGDPIMLFDVINRNFIILGIHFGPQDLYLLALAMLTFIVFIALFTVVFGRVFCGWACPQTIFMEMVFRKIEYFIEGDAGAQRRLNKAPWTSSKVFKKTIKHLIFFGIAILITNTFLSYILGVDEVWKIITEPVQEHLTGFLAMLGFSGLFYGVFAWMREQVCVAICPYGRMQGVLLDESSIVVAYDYIRGEPRGRIKKAKKKAAAANPLVAIQSSVEQPVEAIQNQMGDCIDCKLCIKVCPTGIDIRNGTQLECVNCTACIDACDEVMEKIDRPIGLIRYDSEKGIREGTKNIFTPRVFAYSGVLVALLILQSFLFLGRNDVEVLLLRAPGTLYQEVIESHITNVFNYQISNKTSKIFPVEFRMKNGIGEVRVVGQTPSTIKNEITKGILFVDYPTDKITSRKMEIEIEALRDGKVIDEFKTNFVGPEK